MNKNYDELTLEEQAELKKLLSRYSRTELTDDLLESIAGGVSNENIKKVLSYGVAALTGAGLTVGGMAMMHHNHHHRHDGGPHAGTHFAEHKHHRKHNNMPPQGEHKGMPPQGEHRGMPPQGEQHQTPEKQK